MAIPNQAINPVIPEVFSNHKYTVWLPNMELRKHKPATTVVAYSALRGTPPLDNLAKIRGALPSEAKVNSIRVEAYIPELPADKTAVKITAFITAAADNRPAFWNTSVNGLTLISFTSLRNKLGSVYGIIRLIIRIAKI